MDLVKSASSRGAARLKALNDLNEARNAIAHSQHAKLVLVLNGAPTLRLTQVERWDSAPRGLATTMDNVVGSQVSTLSGGVKPW